eukprot:TRINITY_DN7024_c0_g1_i5.p1 TRINITY_DN7024_c0_g1~~TRINITY_DN7024_c0_g1_i5.p1  ORF type:complete len:119 (-),score=25.18 TRINITY_DN7024_c0_g1_i5:61-417(-)
MFNFEYAGATVYNFTFRDYEPLFTPYDTDIIGMLTADTNSGRGTFVCTRMRVKVPGEHVFVYYDNITDSSPLTNGMNPNNIRWEMELHIYCDSLESNETGAIIAVPYSNAQYLSLIHI